MFRPFPDTGGPVPTAAGSAASQPQPQAPHDPQLRDLARRTVARDEVELHSRITSQTLGTILIRVNDISPYGFQARARGTMLERGASIRLLLPLVGDLEASVMWGLKGMFGCRFETPIEAETYRRVLAAIREDGDRWMERVTQGQ